MHRGAAQAPKRGSRDASGRGWLAGWLGGPTCRPRRFMEEGDIRWPEVSTRCRPAGRGGGTGSGREGSWKRARSPKGKLPAIGRQRGSNIGALQASPPTAACSPWLGMDAEGAGDRKGGSVCSFFSLLAAATAGTPAAGAADSAALEEVGVTPRGEPLLTALAKASAEVPRVLGQAARGLEGPAGCVAGGRRGWDRRGSWQGGAWQMHSQMT